MTTLQGKRVLVIEDEPIVAMLLEDMLSEFDIEIVGTASHLQDAINLAEKAEFDAAVLDVNLGGQLSSAVAAVLRRREIPFVLATGYDAPSSDEFDRNAPILHKPYVQSDLERALTQILVPAVSTESGRTA